MDDPQDRRLPLEGSMNTRDIGGYATPTGRVRTGVVFRSDNLAALTDADVAVLGGLGLRSVVDLRLDHEVQRQPSRLPDTVQHRLHLPIGGDAAGQHTDMLEQMLSGGLDGFTVEEVAAGYVDTIRDHGPTFARIVEQLLDDDGVPALFHCTAGKDRTGLTAMLLHRLLGVSDADLVADYVLSNPLRSERRMAELAPTFRERGVDIERFRPMFGAPEAAIVAAMAAVDGFGGAERYLVDHGGLAPEGPDELRALLIAEA